MTTHQTSSKFWDMNKLMTSGPANQGFPVEIIGFTGSYSEEYNSYSAVMHVRTQKNRVVLDYRIPGYPAPDKQLTVTSKLGQFISHMNGLKVRLLKTGEGSQHETLLDDLNASYAGKIVRITQAEGWKPVVDGTKMDRPLSGKTIIPLEVLGSLDKEELETLRNQVFGESEEESADEDEEADPEGLFLTLSNGKTISESQALAARNPLISQADWYAQVQDGSIYSLMQQSNRIAVEDGVITVKG